jgi:hypothetical protein
MPSGSSAHLAVGSLRLVCTVVRAPVHHAAVIDKIGFRHIVAAYIDLWYSGYLWLPVGVGMRRSESRCRSPVSCRSTSIRLRLCAWSPGVHQWKAGRWRVRPGCMHDETTHGLYIFAVDVNFTMVRFSAAEVYASRQDLPLPALYASAVTCINGCRLRSWADACICRIPWTSDLNSGSFYS